MSHFSAGSQAAEGAAIAQEQHSHFQVAEEYLSSFLLFCLITPYLSLFLSPATLFVLNIMSSASFSDGLLYGSDVAFNQQQHKSVVLIWVMTLCCQWSYLDD